MSLKPWSSLPGQSLARCQPNTTLVTALLGATAIAYLFLLFMPAQRAIANLRQERNEKQQQILQSTSLAIPLVQARQRLETTEQTASQWKQAAPSPSQIVATYARLTEAAQAAGLTLRRFDPQPAADRQVIGEHNLLLAWEGKFSQLFDFVQRVEGLRQTVWIRQLNVAADSEDSETLRGELSLTIFVDLAGNSD